MQGRQSHHALTARATTVGIVAAVVAVDHLTKWLALRELADGHTVDLVWTLRLRLVLNNGGAFGLGSRYAPFIALAVVVVVAILLRANQRLVGWAPRLAMAAVIGGAIGNLLDRIFRDGNGFLGGPVVDFLDLQWWPVFNVADIGVTVGAVVLALTAMRDERVSP